MTFALGATGCAPAPSWTPDHVYRVTVPANGRLIASATPSGSMDMWLNLFEGGCAGVATCLRSANASSEGGSETVDYTNTSGASKVVSLQVSGKGYQTYDLSVTLQ